MAKTETSPSLREDRVIFNVPTKDVLGQPFPGMWINGTHFVPGESYTVSPEVGSELQRLLDNYTSECMRLLQRKVDLKALKQIADSRGYWAAADESQTN